MASKKIDATPVTLSNAIRAAVRDCGTTRYALAQQLGVTESALSRFVSGERGLSLDTLDKLCGLLGLTVGATVSRVRQPSPRGPKPRTEDETMITTKAKPATKTFFETLAAKEARRAFVHNFESRRGTVVMPARDLMCIYNNNPYANYPTLRDDETTLFRAWLKEKGIKEYAYATYPQKGASAGYSYAMLIAAGEDRVAEVTDELRRIVLLSHERMAAAKVDG